MISSVFNKVLENTTIRKAGVLISISMLVILAGCINYEQTTTLNMDGSGSAEIHYWADEGNVSFLSDGRFEFNEDKIAGQYEGPGITVSSVKSEMDVEDSTRHVHVTLEFKNINELAKTKGFEDVDIEWVEDGDLMKFTQEMTSGDDGNGMGMEEYTVTYTYNMPGKIVSSNATEHDGQKLTWEHKLSELSSGVTLSATIEKSSGFGNLLVIIIIVVGAIIVVVIIIFATKKKKPAPAPGIAQETQEQEEPAAEATPEATEPEAPDSDAGDVDAGGDD